MYRVSIQSHKVNILHWAGYQTYIRNVSLCFISLFQDAIPVQHWFIMHSGFPVSTLVAIVISTLAKIIDFFNFFEKMIVVKALTFQSKLHQKFYLVCICF
jgi:hypothetical protein